MRPVWAAAFPLPDGKGQSAGDKGDDTVGIATSQQKSDTARIAFSPAEICLRINNVGGDI
jgi:hypothetical protein